MALSQVSALNLLMDGLVVALSAELIDAVPEDDDSAAGLVRAGRLQDDPTIEVKNILVHGATAKWPDMLQVDELPQIQFPVYEMGSGGGVFWMRRFTTELQLYFDNEYDREVARKKAMVIKSRAEKAVLRMAMPEEDDFTEKAILVQLRESYYDELGGEGTYIWKGHQKLEFLTHRMMS